MVTHQQRLAARQTRRGLRTGIAIVLLALMLFPVYWMLNISLQPSGAPAVELLPTEPGYGTTPLFRIRAKISSPAC